MSGKIKSASVRERLTESLGRNLSGSGTSYTISSAASAKILRKLYGSWTVCEHRLGEELFLERYAQRTLVDFSVENLEYRALYEFREALCLKQLEITGTVCKDAEPIHYRYRLSLASSWYLEGPNQLAVRPELGYQITELDGSIVAFRDLEKQETVVLSNFEFDGEYLVLSEADDFKKLERMV